MKKLFNLLKKFNKRNGEGHCILFFADGSSILYDGEQDEIYMPTTLKQLKKFLKHN